MRSKAGFKDAAGITTYNPSMRISVLTNKKGKVAGFKAKMLDDSADYLSLRFCKDFDNVYPGGGIVIKVIDCSLIFDDSLNRGIRFSVPITVPQMVALKRIFKNSAAYPHENYIVRAIDEESFVGFRFVSPECLEECLGQLSESQY